MTKTIDQKRNEALSNRDAVRYFELCNSLGVEPEAQDLYDRGEAELLMGDKRTRGLESLAVQTPKTNRRVPSTSGRRKSNFDYEGFRREVEESGDYNVSNTFVDIEAKRNLLKKYGMKRLYVGKDEKISIEDARDTRVGQVFRDYYDRASRKAG